MLFDKGNTAKMVGSGLTMVFQAFDHGQIHNHNNFLSDHG